MQTQGVQRQRERSAGRGCCQAAPGQGSGEGGEPRAGGLEPCEPARTGVPRSFLTAALALGVRSRTACWGGGRGGRGDRGDRGDRAGGREGAPGPARCGASPGAHGCAAPFPTPRCPLPVLEAVVPARVGAAGTERQSETAHGFWCPAERWHTRRALGSAPDAQSRGHRQRWGLARWPLVGSGGAARFRAPRSSRRARRWQVGCRQPPGTGCVSSPPHPTPPQTGCVSGPPIPPRTRKRA